MQPQPQLFLIGGPNGAGKSTFAHEFLAAESGFIFLNADEIAREFRPGAVYDARIDAGRAFLTRLAALRNERTNLVVESTVSGVSLAGQLRLFREVGYYIRLAFILVPSANVSISRVAGRVLSGGHHVPTEDIIRRFERSKKNFWHTYQPLADEWQLVLNADANFIYLAEFANDSLTVLDDVDFTNFLTGQDPDSTSLL